MKRLHILLVSLALTVALATSSMGGFTIGLNVSISSLQSAITGFLLNALGSSTKGEQTFSGPTAYLALDHENVMQDFGEVVNADGTRVSAVPGSRLALTVADGAVLGSELFVELDDLDGTIINNGDGSYSINNNSGGNDWAYQTATATTGHTYQITYTINSISSGSLGADFGTPVITKHTTDGTYTDTQTANVTKVGLIFTNTTVAKISNISIREVIPTILDTDGSSNDLHPYVMKSGVRDYQFYAPHATSTAYAVGDKVWAEASDGIRRWYYIDTGDDGTSGGSAPTFPTSGTVVDGTATWTYGGKYTLRGQRVEGAATNLMTYSQEFDNAAWGKVSGSVLADQYVAVDGTTTMDKFTASGGSGSLYDTIAVTEDTTYTLSVWADHLSGGAVNFRAYDISNSAEIFSTPYLADGGRKSVTFVTPSGCTSIYAYPVSAITDGESVGIWGAQLEAGAFSTSYTKTSASTVTRSAVDIPIPTAEITAAEGAGRIICTPLASGQGARRMFASRTDSVNYLEISISATTLTLAKNVASVLTTLNENYTHLSSTQMIVDFSYGSDGMAINAWALGSSIGTPATNTNTTDAVLADKIYIGQRGIDSNYFHATYEKVRLFRNTTQAASELSDWSL